MTVDGVECVTLAHGFQDEVVAHEFYGTPRCLEHLQTMPGWHEGFLDLDSGGCCCGDVGREEGQQDQELFLSGLLQDALCPVSSDLLKDIHSAAMQHSPIPSDFRAHQVYITNQKHIPPKAEDLCCLVQEFCHETWLLRERNTDPYIVSAYCLWWVNHVHPFRDGNGRTARGLAWLVLAQRQASHPCERDIMRLTSFHEYLRRASVRPLVHSFLQELNATVGGCGCCRTFDHPQSLVDALCPFAVFLRQAINHGGGASAPHIASGQTLSA